MPANTKSAMLAVANLAGVRPTPELLTELQAYIDGTRTLGELSQAAPPTGRVLQAVAHRTQGAE